MYVKKYNGKQHYEYCSFFHKNYQDFRNQQYRDQIKKMLCEKEGITLIDIPYTVKLEHIEPYIKDKCSKKGYYI